METGAQILCNNRHVETYCDYLYNLYAYNESANIFWSTTIKTITVKTLVLLFFTIVSVNAQNIEYQIYEQSKGWSDWVPGGTLLGTPDLEVGAIRIKPVGLPNYSRISYRVHVQGIGWMDWVSNGEMTGHEGQSKSLEAIMIRVDNAPGYNICYTAEVGKSSNNGPVNVDWGGPSEACDGKMAGTIRRTRPIEQITITIKKRPPLPLGESLYLYAQLIFDESTTDLGPCGGQRTWIKNTYNQEIKVSYSFSTHSVLKMPSGSYGCQTVRNIRTIQVGPGKMYPIGYDKVGCRESVNGPAICRNSNFSIIRVVRG